jgi:hypothetical protein
LEIIAPMEIPFSDNQRNFILSEIEQTVCGQFNGLRQNISDYRARNLRFTKNDEDALLNQIGRKKEKMLSDLRRDILFIQGLRKKSFKKGLSVQGVESNFAKNKKIFLAHKFDEEPLIKKLKDIIKLNKFTCKEGKRTDLGSISEDILKKIKDCGFFIAVMTKRDELRDENFTTSSWLIEEKGAALAFGHRPLIMVEDGVNRHYVGFLHSDDEMIYFDRSNFDKKIEEAIKKIKNTYKGMLQKT